MRIHLILAVVFAVSTAGVLGASFFDVSSTLGSNLFTALRVASPVATVALLISMRFGGQRTNGDSAGARTAMPDRTFRYAYGTVGIAVIVLLSVASQLDQAPGNDPFGLWLAGVGMLIIGTPAAMRAVFEATG